MKRIGHFWQKRSSLTWLIYLQLEIIDACVSYIESLQDQLRAHDPKILDGVCETAEEADDADAAVEDRGGDDGNNNSSNSSGNKNSVISPKRRNSLRENQRLR